MPESPFLALLCCDRGSMAFDQPEHAFELKVVAAARPSTVTARQRARHSARPYNGGKKSDEVRGIEPGERSKSPRVSFVPRQSEDGTQSLNQPPQ